MEIAELIESNVKMKQENTKLVEEMDIIETMSEAEKVCDTVVKEAWEEMEDAQDKIAKLTLQNDRLEKVTSSLQATNMEL